MLKSNQLWLASAALCAFSPGAIPALAEEEIGEPTPRFIEQVAVLTCQDIDRFQESKICTGEQMRWRLCERGTGAGHLESVAIYECFLRSK